MTERQRTERHVTAPSVDLCAFVDAPAGCAGDMFLGALVALGLDPAFLQDLADRMGLDEVRVEATQTMRKSLAATKVDVHVAGTAMTPAADDEHVLHDDVHQEHAHQEQADPNREAHAHEPLDTSSGHHPHGHTTLAQVLARIAKLGDLTERPWSDAAAVFRALAEAEATVHGTTAESVHFHEVGAADALVDIVGTCAGLHALGVTRVFVGPLPWGSGTFRCAHGEMPNPAPATVHLLTGHPTRPSDASYEQVTPTGAALVRVLSRGHTIPDGFRPERSGFGAGNHEGERLPNLVRITLGSTEAADGSSDEEVCLLETNLDDVSGQVVGRAAERLLADGALDVWHTPVAMKKGRPGVVLSVLCHPDQRAALTKMLFRETPTLGIRAQRIARSILERHEETAQTPWGDVRVKVRIGPDGREATPEYEDCRRLADQNDVPVRRVLEAAVRGWSA